MLFTQNPWIMPGIYPNNVKRRLIKNSLEAIPYFKATANGGSSRVNIIVSIDISFSFLTVMKILSLIEFLLISVKILVLTKLSLWKNSYIVS